MHFIGIIISKDAFSVATVNPLFLKIKLYIMEEMDMTRKALTNKIIVLGVDGMDPRLTKKYLDMGLLPNIKKYLEHGAAREDLVMLGGVPTITPPMWTTLSTGATPATHGITCFWNQHPNKIDTFVYANDSKNCKAEPLWNVTAEAGKKTLVWHWPGCSWPPTSDSKNLHVVEGTQPTTVNFGIGVADKEHIFFVDEAYTEVVEHTLDGVKTSGAGCVIEDMEIKDEGVNVIKALEMPEPQPISMDPIEGECQNYGKPVYSVETPLKTASKWSLELRSGDKEFSISFCDGKVHRAGLLRQNSNGIYDTIELYKSKKEMQPLLVLKNEEYTMYYSDVIFDHHDNQVDTTRGAIALDIDPEGKSFKLWFGNAMKKDCDTLFSPSHLYKDVVDHIGYVPSVGLQLNFTKHPDLLEKIMLPTWKSYGDWQAAAINYLIKQENYEVVYSHFHNVDNFGHVFYEEHQTFSDKELDDTYEKLFQQGYIDTDSYLGEFLYLLDEGWTVIITSDHGLLCKEEPGICPGLGDGFVVNTTVMRELGYTVMKRDENGNELREIDYSKTRAVASRGNHIYINLKSRYPYGIVEDKDKYYLETQIISDLYNYRNQDGKRIVGMAIRNQEGALLGLTGEQCGDILYWLEEGFNRVHGDSLSTLKGHADTSVSPIFIASGAGIIPNIYTDRVIREVDVTPTMAVLLGVRMPRQCEGAPVYQIIADQD